MITALLAVVAYLLGSVPFGVLVTRRYAGKDVRASGSGNIGATNVARVAGKKLGAVVLVLDAAKGAAAVALARWLVPGDVLVHCGVGLLAFLGHVFPVWLSFKGGKGVATALGVIVVLVPWAALAGFVVWLLVLAAFRVSSVGSLLGGVVALVASFVLPGPAEYAWLVVVLVLAMIATHRENLKRLAQRKEHQV